jgi:hypothetical protein
MDFRVPPVPRQELPVDVFGTESVSVDELRELPVA